MTLIDLLLCAFRVIYEYYQKGKHIFRRNHHEKKSELLEEAIEQNAKKPGKELGINRTLFWAYRTSKEAGNELIDFNDVILGLRHRRNRPDLESDRHHRIHHQLHLLKPHRNPLTLREARNQHGRPYHSKGTLHRLE